MADTTLGTVVICCPTCQRDVTVRITTAPPRPEDDPRCIARFQINEADTRAHLLTHTQHDGEPLAA